MPFLIILICLFVFLSGHETQQEKQIKQLEKLIHETAATDWTNGIPMNELATAKKACSLKPNLKGCGLIDDQLADIAVTYHTCSANQRSTLCRAFVQTIKGHKIESALPNIDPTPLPQTPFYLALPTRSLESISKKFNYRGEAWSWWWSKWRAYFLSGFCASFVYSTFLLGHFMWGKNKATLDKLKRKAAAEKAEAVAKRSAQEAFQRRKVEEERQKTLEEENRIAELAQQKRLRAEQHAREQVQAAKLAYEQAEARKALNAAFQPSSGKQPRQ